MAILMYKAQFRAYKSKETDWQPEDHIRCKWLLRHSLVWFVLSWTGDQPRHVIPCSFNNVASRVENKHIIQAFTDSAKLHHARRSLMLLVLGSGGQIPLKLNLPPSNECDCSLLLSCYIPSPAPILSCPYTYLKNDREISVFLVGNKFSDTKQGPFLSTYIYIYIRI